MAGVSLRLILRRVGIAAVCGTILTTCTSEEEQLPEIPFSVWRAEAAFRRGLSGPQDSAQFRAFYYDCVYEGQAHVPDSFYQADLKILRGDSLFLWLIDTTLKRYPEDYDFTLRLKPLFQRWKALFPEDTVRKVLTFVTGYGGVGALTMEEDMCQLCNQHLMIGLHYFLSDTFSYYPPDLPYFIRRRLTEPHIPVFVALRLIRSKMPRLSPRHMPKMIDYMVWYGIQLYALEKLLPELPDTLRLFYTADHMAWLDKHARDAYVELLPYFYESNYFTIQPYVGEEPFTKAFGRQSPPRLGWYFGWQAVRRYANRHKASLRELLGLPVERYATLFQEAGYRP